MSFLNNFLSWCDPKSSFVSKWGLQTSDTKKRQHINTQISTELDFITPEQKLIVTDLEEVNQWAKFQMNHSKA